MSVYSCNPSSPNSVPRPEPLTPPKGASGWMATCLFTQADPVSSLFGLLLQSIGGAFLNWGESIMNTAIADGPAALGSWQIGKFVWDVGCQWGVAGEQLIPGVPPTFPFKCTLFPRWPY